MYPSDMACKRSFSLTHTAKPVEVMEVVQVEIGKDESMYLNIFSQPQKYICFSCLVSVQVSICERSEFMCAAR